MAAANRDDDPTTWFPVAKVPAAASGKAAPAANDDDPTTWFPVATGPKKPPPALTFEASPEYQNAQLPDMSQLAAPESWQRIWGAAKKAYQETPNPLTTEGEAAINQLPLGQNVLNPLIQQQGHVAMGLLHGLGAGATQGAYEVGNALAGDKGGRDAVAMSQIVPFLHLPGTPFSTRVAGPMEASSYPLGPNLLRGMDPVTPDVAARIGTRPGAPASPIPALVEGGAPEPPATPAAPATPPAAAPITTAAQAKAHASGIYQAADAAGGTLTPEFANKFLDRVKAKLPQTEAGQVVGGQSPVSALVERIQALRDKPMTLQAVQEVDEALGRLIDKEYGVKGISKDGLQLQDVQHSFRDMIDAAGEGDITGGSAGFDALRTARKAWSQAMKMDDLERIQARASMTDNPATSIKTQLRTLLNNRSRVRGYDAEEIAALKAATERGTLGGVLHVFGNRLVPLAAGAAEMGTHGLTAGLAAAGASHLVGGKLRSWAQTLQENRLRNAMDVLGTKVPPNPLNLPEAP